MLEKVKWFCSRKHLDKFHQICRYLWILDVFISGTCWGLQALWMPLAIILKIFNCGEMTNMTNSPLYEIKQDDRDIIRGWDSSEHFPEYKYFSARKNRDSPMFFLALIPVRSWSHECCWQRDKINQILASIVYRLYIVAITNCKSLFTNLKIPLLNFPRIQKIRGSSHVTLYVHQRVLLWKLGFKTMFKSMLLLLRKCLCLFAANCETERGWESDAKHLSSS